MKRLNVFALLVVVCLVVFVACGPNGTTPGVPSCPPTPYGFEPIGGTDISSIEVTTNTYAYYEPKPDKTPWCGDQLDIKIAVLSQTAQNALNNLYYSALVAVDVKPDDVWIDTTQGDKPLLTYDLDKHKPNNVDPADCENIICFAYYRWSAAEAKWKFTGSAKVKQIGNPPKWYAEGGVNHLSVFALIELPPAQIVNPPRNFDLVVASEFHENFNGSMSVAFIVRSDDGGQIDPLDQELLYVFYNVDSGERLGEIREECFNVGSVAEQFTCLFPIGTNVELSIGVDGQSTLNRLFAPAFNYGLNFFASPVELYY